MLSYAFSAPHSNLLKQETLLLDVICTLTSADHRASGRNDLIDRARNPWHTLRLSAHLVLID